MKALKRITENYITPTTSLEEDDIFPQKMGSVDLISDAGFENNK